MVSKSVRLDSTLDVQGDTHEDFGPVVGLGRTKWVIICFLVVGPYTRVEVEEMFFRLDFFECQVSGVGSHSKSSLEFSGVK